MGFYLGIQKRIERRDHSKGTNFEDVFFLSLSPRCFAKGFGGNGSTESAFKNIYSCPEEWFALAATGRERERERNTHAAAGGTEKTRKKGYIEGNRVESVVKRARGSSKR